MVDERRWKVGDLASATGLTVRTLHHFDEIGLLAPSERTETGHHLYNSANVRRLYWILAFRQLGMPLGDIGASLDGDSDHLAVAVRGQLEQVEQQLGQQRLFHRRLVALNKAIQESREPSIDQLLDAMEVMMRKTFFTPDQLTRMKARHGEVEPDAFRRWTREWTAICAEVKEHILAEANPADSQVQETARRWLTLMEDMTGGDREILSGMYAKMDARGPEAATLGTVHADEWDYMKRVFAVGFGAPLEPW
jgi:MerR family transcriptional regulator, thiopeptide resistance regulator